MVLAGVREPAAILARVGVARRTRTALK